MNTFLKIRRQYKITMHHLGMMDYGLTDNDNGIVRLTAKQQRESLVNELRWYFRRKHVHNMKAFTTAN